MYVLNAVSTSVCKKRHATIMAYGVRHTRKDMNPSYIHGYDQREAHRLQDQASTLVTLLHADTSFPAGSRVLEAGCGIGAQTITLAHNSPNALITSVDISAASVAETERRVTEAGLTNVHVEQADIFNLPYAPHTFDHLFVCFVLEHLANPVEALHTLKRYVRQSGTITVIEGDHGSAYFHPHSVAAQTSIWCQVEMQRRAGGNAMIGRELYPLLFKAGYSSIRVSPRMVYVDASKPELVEGFTKRTFTAMIEGVREKALAAGIVEESVFDQGIQDLHRTTKSDGTFCYTFFKAFANT